MESAALLVVKPGEVTGGTTTDGSISASTIPIGRSRTWVASSISTYCTSATPKPRTSGHSTTGLQPEVRAILDSIGWWDRSETLEDNLQGWMGWHNLEERWVGKERLDPVVLAEFRRASTCSLST